MKKLNCLLMVILLVSMPFAFAADADVTPEAISLEVDVAEYVTSGLSFSGITQDGANIDVLVNGERATLVSADTDGTFSVSGLTLVDGENQVTIVAQVGAQRVSKDFTVVKDSAKPVVTLLIPDIADEALVVNGTVNEKSNLTIFARPIVGESDLEQVTGLTLGDVKENSIELSWNPLDIDNFARYIIYRDGVAIATTDLGDRTYTDFTDVTVSSDVSYVYQIAVMDLGRNVGALSTAVSVQTASGGLELPAANEADIGEGIDIVESFIVEGDFVREVPLPEDGFYQVRVTVADPAGNTYESEIKEVLRDTSPPQIQILSPSPGAQIYENFADSVTIRGTTNPPEPGARIYLYVQRTPFGIFNSTVDIAGLPNDIEDLGDADFKANCKLAVLGREQCKSHADYQVIADANGNFVFENVDLTSMFSASFRFQQHETGAATRPLVDERSIRDFMESDLLFVGVDAANKKGVEHAKYQVGTCWNQRLTWDAQVMPEFVTPGLLSVERLREGTEELTFTLDLKYKGSGQPGRVTNIYVTDACGNNYLEDVPGYNYSCQVISSCVGKVLADGKKAVVRCPLRVLDGIDDWAESDWSSFIDAVQNEMRFPFRVSLTYLGYDNVGKQESGLTQTFCMDVGYVVDAAKIDPRDVLPDWMLSSGIDFLNESLHAIEDITEKTVQVLRYAAIGCMGSFLFKFATSAWRRVSCNVEAAGNVVGSITGTNAANPVVAQCGTCLAGDPGLFEQYSNGKDIQNKLSDTCLAACYPSCAAAWGTEAKLYSAFRWSCDRVFGHSAPSRWTENADEQLLFNKMSQANSCVNDQSVQGRPLRAVKCKSLEEKYELGRNYFDIDDRCVEIFDQKDDFTQVTTLYRVGGAHRVGEDVYDLQRVTDIGGKVAEVRQVVKQTDDYYLAELPVSCAQRCDELYGPKKRSRGVKVLSENRLAQGDGISSSDVQSLQEGESRIVNGCETTNACINYAVRDNIGGVPVDVDLAVPAGYTQDCFNPETVSNDPDTRVECCCINPKREESNQYYVPSDVETKEGTTGAEYKDMKWSYRYWKINYRAPSGATSYHPNRYIQGRDYSACFGMNNWQYDGTNMDPQKGKVVMIDPMSQHVAAFQCVAITQVLNRLALLSNIARSVHSCLLNVRETGVATAGVCKEVFTQYLCGFIWRIISFIRDGCLPLGSGLSFDSQSESVLQYLTFGLDGIWDSVDDSAGEIAAEYGNAEVNNLIGIGSEDVFRKVCLGAFGYDWDLSFNSFLEVAYNAPSAAFVQPINQRRELLGVDPISAQAKYEYRASWMINPGCDLANYNVYLTCVNREELNKNGDVTCAKQDDPFGQNCDCLGLPSTVNRDAVYYQSRSRISANTLEEIDSSMIQAKVKNEKYRYDHLRFELQVDPNFERNGGDVSNCFGPGHEDGIYYFPIKDISVANILGCSASLGEFSCREAASLFNDGSYGEIMGVDMNIDGNYEDGILGGVGRTYYAGEGIRFNVKYSKDDSPMCMVVNLLNQNGQRFVTGRRAETDVYELKQGGDNLVQAVNFPYNVQANDVLVSGGAIDFIYNEQFPNGNPGIDERPNENKADLVSGTYTVRFIDETPTGGDGIGDRFVVDGGAGFTTRAGDVGDVLHLGGFGLIFRRPVVRDETETYTIKTFADTSETESGRAQWNVKVELRTPEPSGSCDRIGDAEFANNAIFSGGVKQERIIPIEIVPTTARSANACPTDAPTTRIDLDDPNQCACGSNTLNCPVGGRDYCVSEVCTKYPKCADGLNSQACICAGPARPTQYDCAFNNNLPEDDYAPGTRNRDAAYCYNSRCVTEEQGNFVAAPNIDFSQSKIQVKESGSVVEKFLDTIEGLAAVESSFRIWVAVDNEVDELLVRPQGARPTHVSLTESGGNLWTETISLIDVAPGSQYNLRIEAKVNGKIVDTKNQRIIIAGSS